MLLCALKTTPQKFQKNNIYKFRYSNHKIPKNFLHVFIPKSRESLINETKYFPFLTLYKMLKMWIHFQLKGFRSKKGKDMERERNFYAHILTIYSSSYMHEHSYTNCKLRITPHPPKKKKKSHQFQFYSDLFLQWKITKKGEWFQKLSVKTLN